VALIISKKRGCLTICLGYKQQPEVGGKTVPNIIKGNGSSHGSRCREKAAEQETVDKRRLTNIWQDGKERTRLIEGI